MLWVWEKFISYTVEKFCHRNSGTRQTKSGKLPASCWKLSERKNNQRFWLRGSEVKKLGWFSRQQQLWKGRMECSRWLLRCLVSLCCESRCCLATTFLTSPPPPLHPALLLHACLSSLLPVSLPSQCLQQCSVPVLFFPQSRSLLSGASPQNVESLGKEIRIWGFKWHLSK